MPWDPEALNSGSWDRGGSGARDSPLSAALAHNCQEFKKDPQRGGES